MQEILSSKNLMKIGMRGYKEYIDHNWHGVPIKIKTLLDKDEFLELLQDVRSLCSDSNGEAVPEFFDFAVKSAIVTHYSVVELPEDIDSLYSLIYYSDLYDVVIEYANKKQIDAVLHYFGLSR